MTFLLTLVALVAGLAVGEWFPDVDQRFAFLTHRSILTHGLIVPLIFYLVASGLKASPLRLFASGFGLGLAVHLGFDLFPRAWQGYALIHVPFVGWIHPVFSWLWIAASITICLYLSMKLVKGGIEAAALLVGIVSMFIYTSGFESTFWGPLLSLLIGSAIAAAVVLWRVADTEH